MTYKGPRERASSKVKIREELEVLLDEKGLSNIYVILEKLGFKLVTSFMKKRELYSGKGLNASIDLLYGVGYFLELELGVQGERDYFDKVLEDFIRELRAIPVEKTYLEICLETHKCSCT